MIGFLLATLLLSVVAVLFALGAKYATRANWIEGWLPVVAITAAAWYLSAVFVATDLGGAAGFTECDDCSLLQDIVNVVFFAGGTLLVATMLTSVVLCLVALFRDR